MSDAPEIPVLRRKCAPAPPRARQAPSGTGDVVAKALSRAAQDALGLDLAVDTLALERGGADTQHPDGADGELLCLLHGDPRAGLAIADGDLVGALVEFSLTGRLGGAPGPARAASRVDAMLVAGFLDRVLALADGALAAQTPPPWGLGMRCGGVIDDPRLIKFALDDGTYAWVDITISLQGGARAGRLRLAMPVAQAETASGRDPGWADALARNVLQGQVTLTAILARQKLSADRLRNLKPGDHLPLNLSDLDNVVIEAASDAPVVVGRLGRLGGKRAVRIRRDDPPDAG